MKLDPVSILQAIIDHEGDCDLFSSLTICKHCPLGNKMVNGRKANCVDYLKIKAEEADKDEISDIYKKAAEEELFNIEIDAVLSE